MPEQKRKKSIKEISPIDVYKLLPKTNCGECHEANCMTFATKVVNGELALDGCTPMTDEKYRAEYRKLLDLMTPPVRTITIGNSGNTIKIGGKYVLDRHDFTFTNPAPIALDVADYMERDEIAARLKMVKSFTFNYIGRTLRLDAIAVRSTSDDSAAFVAAVKYVAAQTGLPLVLCSYSPEVMAAGLGHVKDRHPLLYAATRDNWKEMADVALKYQCPLVASAPHDVPGLRSLVKTLVEYGVTDLVLDPGTSVEPALARTIHEFSQIRRSAFLDNDELLGYPLLGTPISAWLTQELSRDVIQWKEAWMAAMLLSRYADMLIMHSVEGWALLPQLIWRFNIYTDPRKPVSVDAGVRSFGSPGRMSPVLITSNYALTYFIVENDIKSANIDCYLVVADTGGNSVESAVAGRYLTAESISNALKECKVADMVDHRHLVLPGLAARLSGEIEELSGWRIVVGPRDSSGLHDYLKTHWPPEDTQA